MNELIARCAGQFIPKSADDFVGDNIVARQSGDQTGARLVAQQVAKAVRMANANGQTPLKFLFNGKPGLGKSALVQYLQHLTGCTKWSTTKLNGTECKMERIEEIPATCTTEICSVTGGCSGLTRPMNSASGAGAFPDLAG